MFESAFLLGPTERSIIVQTHRGRNVKNSIEPDVGDAERRKYERLLREYGSNWVRRKPATGVYNCAGHVWASRRTSIFEESEYGVILTDDGYRRLGEGSEPLPGDLVVYRDTDPKVGFLHSGTFPAYVWPSLEWRSFPWDCPQLTAVSSWAPGPGEVGQDFQVILRLTVPGREVPGVYPKNFTQDRHRTRLFQTVYNIVIPQPGLLRFELLLNGVLTTTYDVRVSAPE